MGPTYAIAYVTKQPVSTDRLLEVFRHAVEVQARQFGIEDVLVYLIHDGGDTAYRETFAQAGVFGIELIHDEFMAKVLPEGTVVKPVQVSVDRSLANSLYSAGIAALADIGVSAVGVASN